MDTIKKICAKKNSLFEKMQVLVICFDALKNKKMPLIGSK
jgi:hypothetical protein